MGVSSEATFLCTVKSVTDFLPSCPSLSLTACFFFFFPFSYLFQKYDVGIDHNCKLGMQKLLVFT